MDSSLCDQLYPDVCYGVVDHLTGHCNNITQCGHIQSCPRIYVNVIGRNCKRHLTGCREKCIRKSSHVRKVYKIYKYICEWWNIYLWIVWNLFVNRVKSIYESRDKYLWTIPHTQSPGLNILRNVWIDLKRAMQTRQPKNLTELKAFCKEEWSEIPKQELRDT